MGELWKEKLWWTSSWDQAALAETVLEIVGAEIWKLSSGQRSYDMRCLARLLPVPDGTYTYGRYCDCWYSTLQDLVGPYRRRLSRIVSFVDPERVEVNFIPNNLFWNHNYMLENMYLVPKDGQTLFKPMVIHWAGMGERRVPLMQRLLSSLGANFSDGTCPRLAVNASNASH